VITLYSIHVFINNRNELPRRSKVSDVAYHNVVKSVNMPLKCLTVPRVDGRI
jgi:hypothetical protein